MRSFSSNRKRVLIIDDEPSTASVMAFETLRTGPHLVVVTSDGLSALEAISTRPKNYFDLILCDWILPGVDGLFILKKFRTFDKKTPFLIVTAKNTERDVESAKNLGTSGFITKPFSSKMLAERICLLLENNKGH